MEDYILKKLEIMNKILIFLTCMLASFASINAQQVTKSVHKKALKTDVVTTGTMTIHKPNYICISTDGGKDQLIMDGTKFTMTLGNKQHITDSRRNMQFATFHEVLKAVINNQPIPESTEVSITTKNRQRTVVITPSGKKKRQMFTSFELVIDDSTSAIRWLRMNGRGGNYITYEFK